MSAEPLRVANCSGFYGDRLSAARELLEGGPIDVLTGDYLAELTMLILWKSRRRDPDGGYAVTFLRQLEDVLGLALERGVKIVVNAGGLNPAGLAERVRELAERLGLAVDVAHVEGDDLLPRLGDLQAAGEQLAHLDTGVPLAALDREVVSANAYLGAWGIVEALASGADVVVCPRVTDASLVVGPAAWHFGWARDDWDRLAGAVVAGHVLECGPHATGGNYAFLDEVERPLRPGFPIAELHADGSSTITKHPGTGGLVSVGTVTAQLLYEIDGPAYLGPDATALFDTIRLEQASADRVSVTGVRGAPPPPTLKVAVNYLGGYRNSMTLVLTGLELERKAELARRGLLDALGDTSRFDELDFRLVGGEGSGESAPAGATAVHGDVKASAELRVTVKGQDAQAVGRDFSNAVIELALASYPGFYATTPPGAGSAFGVYWPTLVPARLVEHTVVTADGRRLAIDPAPTGEAPAAPPAAEAPAPPPAEPTARLPLGTAFGARSGDKGGNANVGLWARDEAAFAWLDSFLTVERFRELVPEAAALEVRRYRLANLRALNFVVVGLLGEGVAATTRPDAQAKSLGEALRARVVDLPLSLAG
jgi:hypothetical protein